MTSYDMTYFLIQFAVVAFLGSYLLKKIRGTQMPPIPARLLQLQQGFLNGKPNRRYWESLRAEPMFDEHYKKVPGRMSCTILPYECNKENVWQFRVGFKTTAADKPSKFISIPVYADGKIYDV